MRRPTSDSACSGGADSDHGSSAAPARVNAMGSVLHDWFWSLAAYRPRFAGLASRAASIEIAAGAMGSLVSIAYCVSYSALIFQGELAGGLSFGLWSFLAATAVATLVVTATTTLPPGIAGPRNPTVAVMSVLVAGIAAATLARNGSAADAVRNALVGLAAATLLTGVVFTLLGSLRLGQAVRFVPYPVIAGFLAASGWLLIVGGLKVAYALPLPTGPAMDPISGPGAGRVGLALLFFFAIQIARRVGASGAMLPIAFFGSAALFDLVLWGTGNQGGWYLPGSAEAKPWSPLQLVAGAGLDWVAILGSSVEIGAVAGVAVITLLLDVSSLEAQRGQTADMDRDFRANGIANLIVTPLGGASVAMAPNSSRLIEEAGGRTRLSGLAGGMLVAVVLVSGLDVATLLPTPVLGGLLVLLGAGVMRDALGGAPGGRSRLDLALALAIMACIVQFGYLPGVVLGLVASCIAFAVRYSRIGVIRRHLTRTEFAAAVERPAEEKALLATEGWRIHVFWLEGFIFFGSSNGLFETVRAVIGTDRSERRRWVVLDMAAVSGLDTSALLSFAKLAAWARRANVGLMFTGLSVGLARDFLAQGIVGGVEGARTLPTRGEALEICEEELVLEMLGSKRPQGIEAFNAWLASELGGETSARVIDGYLQRRELGAGAMICRQGEASDSIDLVAAGGAAILFLDQQGRSVRVRRMAGRTVVGEMGFFRHLPRTTSVAADGPAVLFTMTRESYDRLAREHPRDAARFLEFIVRQLADRVEHSTKEIAALV